MGHDVNIKSKDAPYNFSKDEINSFTKKFQSIDKDKKGYITLNDLRKHLSVSMKILFLFFSCNTYLNKLFFIIQYACFKANTNEANLHVKMDLTTSLAKHHCYNVNSYVMQMSMLGYYGMHSESFLQNSIFLGLLEGEGDYPNWLDLSIEPWIDLKLKLGVYCKINLKMDIASQFGIQKSTLSTILKNKQKLKWK